MGPLRKNRGYEKTVLSELQGAWQNLQHALVEQDGTFQVLKVGDVS